MSTPTGLSRRHLLHAAAAAATAGALGLVQTPAQAAVPDVWRFTTSTGQASRIEFPAGVRTAPLVIQFKGLGQYGDGFQVPVMAAAAKAAGWAVATSNFHGDGYGSPTVMADVRALLAQAAAAGATFPRIVLWGNSMGGVGALNALLTKTVKVSGVYLTDPVVSLRHRYDNGRAGQITAAYGIAADGSDYDARTAGYDPAIRRMANFPLVPYRVVASKMDALVPMAAHGSVLLSKLGSNRVKLLDIGTTGHNTADRFITSDLTGWLSRLPA